MYGYWNEGIVRTPCKVIEHTSPTTVLIETPYGESWVVDTWLISGAPGAEGAFRRLKMERSAHR